MSSSNNVASFMLWVSKCAWTCEILLQFPPCMERTTRMKHTPNPHQKALSLPFATSPKNHTKNLTWSPWPLLNVTWSIEGSLSPACVRERVKSLPHASCLKFKRWPLKEEASSCTRSETASKLLDMDQSYGGWPALQHPPNFRSCNIEMGSKKRSKTSPSSSQSWQTTKCVANKRLDLLLYEVAWLHDVSRAQAHACKSGAKVARFRAPDSTRSSTWRCRSTCPPSTSPRRCPMTTPCRPPWPVCAKTLTRTWCCSSWPVSWRRNTILSSSLTSTSGYTTLTFTTFASDESVFECACFAHKKLVEEMSTRSLINWNYPRLSTCTTWQQLTWQSWLQQSRRAQPSKT